jgi:hypothetical protein
MCFKDKEVEEGRKRDFIPGNMTHGRGPKKLSLAG